MIRPHASPDLAATPPEQRPGGISRSPLESEILEVAAEALNESIVEMGGINAVATIAGVGGDTMCSWIHGGNRDWRLDSVAALGAAMVIRTGRFPLLDRWTESLAGKVRNPVAWRLASNPAAALPALIIEVQWLAVLVAKRRITRVQALQLLDELPDLRRILDRIENGTRSLLGAVG